jgi:hypothetical protein
MTAFKITCTVIPEYEDDSLSAKFLVVAPEDRIVWIATAKPGQIPDLSPAERKRAVAQAGLKSLLGKLRREEAKDGDILELTDEQIDCRDRNLGRCSRFPHSTAASRDCPEGAVVVSEEDCYPGVLECWMLEEEMD